MGDGFSYLSVLIGAIAYALYGGIYYSVVLSPKKKDSEGILHRQSAGPLKYIYSVIAAFVISFVMAIIIHSIGSDSLLIDVGTGFLIGLMITLVYLKNRLFGLMPKRSFFVAIGDHLVIFTILGIIHGFMM
jgi:hypothetical protein